MMLVCLIILPLIGGVLALFFGRRRPAWAPLISLITLLVYLILALAPVVSGKDSRRPDDAHGGEAGCIRSIGRGYRNSASTSIWPWTD